MEKLGEIFKSYLSMMMNSQLLILHLVLMKKDYILLQIDLVHLGIHETSGLLASSWKGTDSRTRILRTRARGN